jgi:hypothetical protein
VPNTWNATEGIEYVSAVIEANVANDCSRPSIRELVQLQRVVELPVTPERLEVLSVSDANTAANGISL